MAVIKVAQPPIRVITQSAFLERFTQSERISIRKLSKTDDIVFDIYEGLKLSPRVRLDFDQVETGLNYLVSVGIITNEKIPLLLMDGSEDERY